MNKLFEPEAGIMTVQYGPDERADLAENPPRFTWIAAQMENDRYVLQISSSADFDKSSTETIEQVPYNFYTPNHPLEPGTYYWRYALLECDETGALTGTRTEWSRVRRFEVPTGLPSTPLASRDNRYTATSFVHPRLWLQPAELDAFRGKLQSTGDYCSWNEFFERSVKPWLEREFIKEPAGYPDNKRVAKLWRQMYMDCQECLYAVRHLSIAGVILEDEAILDKAKQWLLHIASWDTEGTTSRDYNDEAAFRIAGGLAWGYDWLYNHLTDDERKRVRGQLLRRTEQVAYHVIERSKIHHVPYDSHSVRSLSSVLIPCCMAMLHEEPKAQQWLDYAVEYFAGLYSPWGGQDGGWAEGPMYWTTQMAFVTEALNLLKKYTGINIYERPFFAKTGDFPLYCFSPETIRASFGDQSTLGDPVSLKTGTNMRQYAGLTGNGMYQWFYEQTKKIDVGSEMKFYNYGWWDFRFDEMLYKHDYPEVEAVPPTGIEPVKWFKDIGWVAMHHRMDDFDEHIMLLTKSSRYGSVSHSHGDQNGFLLHAYGEPLAIESGYYVAFGSTMHLNWRKQTISTNNILIDGKGQYAGTNKAKQMEAFGKVLQVESNMDYGYVRSDATAAYREHVPYLNRYEREIYFFNRSYFVIVDYVDLAGPGKVDWLFHTLHRMTIAGQKFKVNGDKAEMEGRFVYCSSGELKVSQHDRFIDVDPAELQGLDNQWHLTATTREARSHRIVTLLVPMKKGQNKYVPYILDDQDHGVHIYFTDNGITQKVEVGKAY